MVGREKGKSNYASVVMAGESVVQSYCSYRELLTGVVILTIGMKIAECRKGLGITQGALAEKLDVTNQAVSKWETDQCYPDVTLLPKLADIFGISIDALFGRVPGDVPTAKSVPWENDDAFYIALYHGHELIATPRANERCVFTYEGPAKDVFCSVNLNCDNIEGNATAEGNIECGDVGGAITASGYVECGDVSGHVMAGGYVECKDVEGNVSAGAYVECADVGGNVEAGAYVECAEVKGTVKANGYVECGHGSELQNGGNQERHDGPLPAPDFWFPFKHFNPFRTNHSGDHKE